MREPMHPVTQRFRDAAVEHAYLAHVTREARRPFQVIVFVALAGSIAAWFSDPGAFRTDGNVDVIHRARLIGMYPLLAVAVPLAFAPDRWFAPAWRYVYAVIGVAIVVVPVVACSQLPDPEQFDVIVGYISVICVMVAGAAMLPIGTPLAIATVVAQTIPLMAIALIWEGYEGDAAGWVLFAAAIAAFVTYQVNLRDRLAFAAQYRLDEERARSERLLRNVLPAPVAERLKAGEVGIADRFEHATVLFADLVGFTAIAAKLQPEQLVAALDEVFSAFDDIAARHDLEKIKTIGDAYMVVGGVPAPRDDHAVAVARMAIEMRALIASKRFDGQALDVRIGLHSGPVVAGVIGKQKFIYDLWGDTVNTASRMESSGVPGGIQVTAETEALLRGRFTLEPRGKITVKGKGELDTWMLVA